MTGCIKFMGVPQRSASAIYTRINALRFWGGSSELDDALFCGDVDGVLELHGLLHRCLIELTQDELFECPPRVHKVRLGIHEVPDGHEDGFSFFNIQHRFYPQAMPVAPMQKAGGRAG